jgi:8-oxo-dGTP pyrophosphatase MutT (NUDIX family)
VNNAVGKVYELPGGSASTTMDPIQVIKGEIEEETGIIPDEDRIEYVSSRQLMATFSVHQSHLYLYTLNKEEYDILCKDTGIHGADDDERCSLHMIGLKDLYKYPVDYSTIGMIFEALKGVTI